MAVDEPGSQDRLALAPELVQAWRRLEMHAFLPTQSCDFVKALADSMLADKRIRAFHAGEGAAIEAILPLCRDDGRHARWHMAGPVAIFEPGDAICTGELAALRLAEVLVREPRATVLDRMPSDSRLIPALCKAMRGRGLMAIRPAPSTPTIALDESWENPLDRFNSGRRSDFRRAERRAAGIGAVSFETHTPAPHEFDALFNEAIAVERLGWKSAVGSAIAVDRNKEAFFRAYFRSVSENGDMRISFMRIDGKAVAMHLAVVFNERLFLFKIGHDEAFRKCSPGTLLMLHVLRSAALEGLASFELLGTNEPWITELWTRDAHTCVQLRLYPFGLAGVVAFAADAAAWVCNRLFGKRR